MRGAGRTIASVMPVSTTIAGGMGRPGLTRVWNVPRHSPPRTFTAPISVMAHSAGDAPVVSMSSTQNVTSHRGVPRSSNVRAWNGSAGRTPGGDGEAAGMAGDRIEHVFEESRLCCGRPP